MWKTSSATGTRAPINVYGAGRSGPGLPSKLGTLGHGLVDLMRGARRKAFLLQLVQAHGPHSCAYLPFRFCAVPSSQAGTDHYGDKAALLGVVLVPLLLYVSLRCLRPNARSGQRVWVGVALFLSLVMTVWVGSIPPG